VAHRLHAHAPEGDITLQDPALEPFFDEGLIHEVIRPLASGKEARIWLCRANTRLTGEDLIVAKTYHQANVRDFSDSSAYLDGRFRKVTSEVRAMQKKNKPGREFSQTFWVSHEWGTLSTLHDAGCEVPRPVALAERGMLLRYLGDDRGPAPQLREMRPEPELAGDILKTLLRTIERFLLRDVIHADLSPYNVLWWEEQPWVIDFPQAIDARFNSNARAFLGRDVERLCEWAAKHGADTPDPVQVAGDLWTGWEFAALVPDDLRDLGDEVIGG
jgi:RIO kinase 1